MSKSPQRSAFDASQSNASPFSGFRWVEVSKPAWLWAKLAFFDPYRTSSRTDGKSQEERGLGRLGKRCRAASRLPSEDPADVAATLLLANQDALIWASSLGRLGACTRLSSHSSATRSSGSDMRHSNPTTSASSTSKRPRSGIGFGASPRTGSLATALPTGALARPSNVVAVAVADSICVSLVRLSAAPFWVWQSRG